LTYATEIVLQYRLALQYLWNHHFWPDQSYRNWDGVDALNKVKLPLFVSLVSERLGPDFESPSEIFGEPYQAVPRFDRGERSVIPRILVDVGLPAGPGENWQPIVGQFSKQALRLTILDFYDWEILHLWDLRYYRVRIDAFEGHPTAVGRHGLVEVLDVDVLWDPPGIVGLPMNISQPTI
jgi:hypothetical protein